MMKIIALFLYVLCMSSHSIALTIYGDQVDIRNLDDQDNDGVINIRDACPNTPARAAIDNVGCHQENTKLLSVELNILFASGRSEVKPLYYREIKKLADFLNDTDGSTVIIEGHTDNVGSAESNKALSLDRASAIQNVLVNSFRINSDRVSAVGHGADKPIASNASSSGRSQNRRVVAEVFSQSTAKVERWDIYSVDRR